MNSKRLTTNIAGISMKNPVMVASGTFGFGKEYDDCDDLEKRGDSFGDAERDRLAE